jgi:two-component system NtrC family sensor kinase
MATPQPEKILVVDDDAEARSLVADQVLAPQGFTVAQAADGPSGLQQALKLVPDVLITSLDLPGLSGRDLLAALRSQGFETLVIATGPREAHAQVLQAFRLGARDYLAKPLREAEVVASVDRALAELRMRRERQQLADRLAGANAQLEKRVRELTTLAGIGKAVTAITSLGQLFTRVVEAGAYVTEGDLAWLVLAEDGTTGRLILRAAKNLPAQGTHGVARVGQPWDDGVAALLMLSGEAIMLAGPSLGRLRAGQVAQAVVAAPLKARDQVLGVLAVGRKGGRPFSDHDQAMLSAVADYAAVALVNAHLFQAMEARVQGLQKALDEARAAQAAPALATAPPGLAQLRQPVGQARSALEQLLRGSAGGLSHQQAQLAKAALAQLDAAGRQLDTLAPASRDKGTTV